MSTRSSFHHRPRATPREGFLGRLLDPIDRLAETIYSILILLTFTLAFRIFNLGSEPSQAISSEHTYDLLIGALGAIFAWGVIDGIMHVLIAVFERGERHRILTNLRVAGSEPERVEVIADELDFILEPITGEEERQALYRSILTHLQGSQPRRIGFKREDFAGALGCVLVAMISVLPSLAPFVLLPNNPALAIRLSNVISFLVLFAAGYSWGRHTGANPWKTGLLLLFVGVLMVAVAIPLGG